MDYREGGYPPSLFCTGYVYILAFLPQLYTAPCALFLSSPLFSTPKEFGSIRVVEIDGQLWFVGKDVAESLGYNDYFGALKKHVDTDDKQNCQNDSFKTNRGMTAFNESGLYSLIMSSKLPTAKQFRILRKLEIHYTPKHGSWLDIAEIELNVMTRQCLSCRIGSLELLTAELAAWEQKRNNLASKVNWHFRTKDAREKLVSLYLEL